MLLAHGGGGSEVVLLILVPLGAVAVWQFAAKWRGGSTR